MSFNITLTARGRIYNSTGKVNAPGNAIKGVRLIDYDEERDVLLIRGDPVNAPEAWFEIELPLRLIREFLLYEKKDEEDTAIKEEDMAPV